VQNHVAYINARVEELPEDFQFVLEAERAVRTFNSLLTHVALCGQSDRVDQLLLADAASSGQLEVVVEAVRVGFPAFKAELASVLHSAPLQSASIMSLGLSRGTIRMGAQMPVAPGTKRIKVKEEDKAVGEAADEK
jgi:hypothetical protein